MALHLFKDVCSKVGYRAKSWLHKELELVEGKDVKAYIEKKYNIKLSDPGVTKDIDIGLEANPLFFIEKRTSDTGHYQLEPYPPSQAYNLFLNIFDNVEKCKTSTRLVFEIGVSYFQVNDIDKAGEATSETNGHSFLLYVDTLTKEIGAFDSNGYNTLVKDLDLSFHKFQELYPVYSNWSWFTPPCPNINTGHVDENGDCSLWSYLVLFLLLDNPTVKVKSIVGYVTYLVAIKFPVLGNFLLRILYLENTRNYDLFNQQKTKYLQEEK